MSGQQVAFRYGQDSPARIAASTSMLTESSAFLPGEPYVPQLIPFYPPLHAGPALPPGYTITESGITLWTSFPSRLDLEWYQGDDISVPLYLASDVDMSAWTWECQVRDYHNYEAPLTYEMGVVVEFLPAVDPDPAMNKVTLSLSRVDNTVVSFYDAWELYSVSDQDVLTTWMYGLVRVVRRGSTTDVLPETPTEPPVPVGWNGGWFVGPNGRVP